MSAVDTSSYLGFQHHNGEASLACTKVSAFMCVLKEDDDTYVLLDALGQTLEEIKGGYVFKSWDHFLLGCCSRKKQCWFAGIFEFHKCGQEEKE